MQLSDFPALNACLNSTSAVFLVLGFYFVKNKKIDAHRACMLIAAVASTIFLACYLYYHYYHGSTKFQGQGWIRPVYFTILITHTILAILNLPFILKTFWHALRGDIEKHKKIARLTFPMWLYVSVTGVVIYLMLYQM
jgi:uncharacterized membrane protein YozB (DUF420 family)